MADGAERTRAVSSGQSRSKADIRAGLRPSCPDMSGPGSGEDPATWSRGAWELTGTGGSVRAPAAAPASTPPPVVPAQGDLVAHGIDSDSPSSGSDPRRRGTTARGTPPVMPAQLSQRLGYWQLLCWHMLLEVMASLVQDFSQS